MDNNYTVKKLDIADLDDALNLVLRVFLEFEAPAYCEAGVNEFRSFIEYNSIKAKLTANEFKMWCCLDKSKIIGVIAVRPPLHISLLFVDKKYHNRGIARSMLREVISYYKTNGKYHEITVNSSPYAAEVYHKFGFKDTDTEQTVNGIRFIPMKCPIKV